MLKINKITPETTNIYFKNETGEYIHVGEVNEYELNDFRVQIKRTGSEGYFVKHNDQYHSINKNGRISDWPHDLFFLMINQLSKL